MNEPWIVDSIKEIIRGQDELHILKAIDNNYVGITTIVIENLSHKLQT